jgi:predicted NBD/HSP70 family sugar kinase
VEVVTPSSGEGADGGRSGFDQRAMRRHNLGLVMRHIARHGPRSRATIAQETGLNKATVWSLVADLTERGLLSESGPTNLGSVGRPARGVRLAGDGIAAIGLEVGERHLTACAVDLTGVVRFQEVMPHENRGAAPEAVIAHLATMAREALRELERQSLTPVGVTVALPGLVDVSRGILFVGPNVGWSEVPIADLLGARLGPVAFPIRADNDANLGALAELWEGVGRSLQDFIFVYGEIGTGIGSGIVAGGNLFRGLSGFSGEIGHLRLSRRGPRCHCGGTGCLEVLAGWDELMRLAGMGGFDSAPGQADAARREILSRARAGDNRTMRALSEVSRWLSAGLTSVANLLSPQAIILGGHLAELGDWLVPRIERDLIQYVLASKWSRCRVLVSELGTWGVVRGAAPLAHHEVLADPTVVRCPHRARVGVPAP